MKLGAWSLILALFAWSVEAHLWLPLAMADTTTVVTTTLSTATRLSTSISTQITTSPDPNQQQAQQDNQKNNDDGSNKAQGMGMAAIAAGMAMVAAGMAMMSNPQTQAMGMALVAAGMALIAAGMAAMQAADKMKNNANKSGNNAANMSTITGGAAPETVGTGGTSTDSTTSTVAGTELGTKTGTSGGIKIDPALTRTGKIDTIMTKFENNTGIGREAFVDALNKGVSPIDMLAHAPSLAGNKNASLDNLNKAFNTANSKDLLSAGEVMDQLGLTPDDLPGGGGTYDMADGRSPSSAGGASGPNADSFFGNKDEAGAGGAVTAGLAGGISPDVQASLDHNGLSGRTIFDMVHSQYMKKTPMLWGVTRRKGPANDDNPFTGNLPGKRIEL